MYCGCTLENNDESLKQMAEQNSQKTQFRYQDVPELRETFADSIGQWHFDGGTLRVEFLVNRFDDAKAGETRTARKVPVSRLVLSAAGTVELLNECRRIAAALEKVGMLKKELGDKPELPQ